MFASQLKFVYLICSLSLNVLNELSRQLVMISVKFFPKQSNANNHIPIILGSCMACKSCFGPNDHPFFYGQLCDPCKVYQQFVIMIN